MATFTEMLFHEYFHCDNATGLGASHQTDSTGIIAKLIQMLGETARPAGVTRYRANQRGNRLPESSDDLGCSNPIDRETGLGCISQSACATMQAAPKLANFDLKT